jgi:hypothetical protein
LHPLPAGRPVLVIVADLLLCLWAAETAMAQRDDGPCRYFRTSGNDL